MYLSPFPRITIFSLTHWTVTQPTHLLKPQGWNTTSYLLSLSLEKEESRPPTPQNKEKEKKERENQDRILLFVSKEGKCQFPSPIYKQGASKLLFQWYLPYLLPNVSLRVQQHVSEVGARKDKGRAGHWVSDRNGMGDKSRDGGAIQPSVW